MILAHKKLGRLQETDTTWYREALCYIGEDEIDMVEELGAYFDVVERCSRTWECTWGFVKNKTFEELEESHGKAEYLEQSWRGKKLGVKFKDKEWIINLPRYETWDEDDGWISILPKNLSVKINNDGRCIGIINGERCHVAPRNGELCAECKKIKD